MRTANPIKTDQVREEILRGAIDLFKNFGIDKTTMEDIAEAAGKGKSTLYYYFKTKEDVFYAAALQENARMQEVTKKGLLSAKTAAEKVKLFFSIQDSELRTKIKLYPIIFKETRKYIQLFHRLQRQSNTWEAHLFKTILYEGIASGEFKSIKKEDCETIALTAVTSLHSSQLNVILDGKIPSASDRLGVMIEIFVRGLK